MLCLNIKCDVQLGPCLVVVGWGLEGADGVQHPIALGEHIIVNSPFMPGILD